VSDLDQKAFSGQPRNPLIDVSGFPPPTTETAGGGDE
jgi:hypothetical protein